MLLVDDVVYNYTFVLCSMMIIQVYIMMNMEVISFMVSESFV